MLTNLHVKNLALIEETEINFTEGLNILSGETGAGKSILIGSINYCLGQKADKDVIRESAEYALVELVFHIDNEKDVITIRNMDFPIEEDGSLILSRKIMPSRSVFKVCGEAVTAKQMKDLASILIDIHGQHEHQSLLLEKKQAQILDEYASEKLNIVTNKISDLYEEYTELQKEFLNYSMDESQREREISLAEYEVNEIESANLISGEEEELNKRYKLMQGSRKILETFYKSVSSLSNQDPSALGLISYTAHDLSLVAGLDDKCNEFYERISDIENLLADYVKDAKSYVDDLDFSEEEFANTEDRLNTINHLVMKYGGSIDKVNQYLLDRQEELDKLRKIHETRDQLEDKINSIRDEILNLCDEAHNIRVSAASKLSKEIIAVLEELNFLKVNFEIAVNKREKFNSKGFDDVTFMISLNPGEAKRPISKVASGGELSRIMLALKVVFAESDSIDTLIFDEIDTGISGKTAWKVSEQMGLISRKHQVICITHLPQIAAMADSHFLIEKAEKSGKTVTSINKLAENERIDELSRMLGSDNITEAVRLNAADLINNAIKVKNMDI